MLYRHFVDELGFRNIDFLLPDENHDTMTTERAHAFTTFMSALLKRYTSETRKDVQIRFFEKIINATTMASFFASVLHRYHAQRDVVFTVSSKGDIAPDDILRTCDPQMMRLDLNVATASLKDVLLSPGLAKLNDDHYSIPNSCSTCEWANVCRGGDLYHRYKTGSGFNHSSVYCETLKVLHARIAEIAHRSGMPLEKLEERLSASPRVFV